MVNKNQIVIFGAGKIGRSFIGQLFGCSGYKVIFIDVDSRVIAGLNEKGSYRVVIKGETDEEIIVPNVSAISAFDKEKVIDAVSKADILAVSVGKNVLEQIVSVIAAGIEKRCIVDPNTPLDIILAENMRSAADFMRGLLVQNLPLNFAVDKLLGLVETSIGKMVPIIPQAQLEKDPLVVYAEAYNSLILDENGFKNPIPNVKGLAPKSNIKAWVDRKAFVHNLGHATAAYYGFAKHPDAVYMYEVLDDPKVLNFTRSVMLQSAQTLLVAYPDDFTMDDLKTHIEDLICRFRNKALKDTIFRVGMDLQRKLGSDDRFMGAVQLAMENNQPYGLILEAMSYGLFFRVKDEVGNGFPSDIAFLESLEKDFELTLIKQLGYGSVHDRSVIEKLMIFYKQRVIMQVQ